MVRAFEAATEVDYVGGLEAGDDLRGFLAQAQPQALVDFTHPSVALQNALAAVEAGAAPVIGTTGIPAEGVDAIEAGCLRRGLGGIVAPNFAIGAVLMIHLAEIAAPFFDSVEIVEMHHATKADAPSGTALATASRLASRRSGTPFQRAASEKLTLEGVRGGSAGEVGIHSLRLPGVVADQEVILGLTGQTLTIGHRTTSREAFVPGVMLAVSRVVREPTFYRALDELLGLG
jgi:4-hydroxy-tetrahydrodipicolinate reductase